MELDFRLSGRSLSAHTDLGPSKATRYLLQPALPRSCSSRVWYDTSLCLGSNASNSVMILLSGPSCCNVTQHSALHLSLFYIKQYITTLQWATTHTHGASVCRILLISFVFPQIASVICGQCVLFSSFFLCLAMYSSRGLSCNRGSLTRLSFSPSLQADKR